MKHPDSNGPERFDSWFEGNASEEAQAELIEELKRDGDLLDDFVREASFRHDLGTEARMAMVSRAHLAALRPRVGLTNPVHRSSGPGKILALAATVVLLAVAGALLLRGPATPAALEPAICADLLRTFPEQGPQGRKFRVGDRFELAQGFAEVRFVNGHSALLEGSTDLLFEAPDRVKIDRGRAVFHCPGGKFSVITPNAVVEDLGTVFGVELLGKETTRTVVYEGAVGLRGRDQSKGMRIDRGWQGQVAGSATASAAKTTTANDFRLNWEQVRHSPVVSGEIHFTGALSSGTGSEAPPVDAIRFSLERDEWQPEESMPVFLVNPTTHEVLMSSAERLSPPAPVDCYRFVFRPESIHHCRAQVTFPGKIVGIVVAERDMKEWDAQLGESPLGLPESRALELKSAKSGKSPPFVDLLRVKEDQRTLELDLDVRGSRIDEFRVIVIDES